MTGLTGKSVTVNAAPFGQLHFNIRGCNNMVKYCVTVVMTDCEVVTVITDLDADTVVAQAYALSSLVQ